MCWRLPTASTPTGAPTSTSWSMTTRAPPRSSHPTANSGAKSEATAPTPSARPRFTPPALATPTDTPTPRSVALPPSTACSRLPRLLHPRHRVLCNPHTPSVPIKPIVRPSISPRSHPSNGPRPACTSGRWYIARCPLHHDTNPSFWIDTDRAVCGCHAPACRAHSRPLDYIALYALLNQLSVPAAIRHLMRPINGT
jgi:hypothetical protein